FISTVGVAAGFGDRAPAHRLDLGVGLRPCFARRRMEDHSVLLRLWGTAWKINLDPMSTESSAYLSGHPKPANGGQGKTGQREEAGDSVVLPCSLLWRQVHFRTPTPRTPF